MDAAFVARVARDDLLAAHASFRMAVGADAGELTGGICVQTCGVEGACDGVDAFDAALHVGDDLVHARDDADMLGAVQQQSEAVGVAIDVDELAIERDCVRAHEEPVRAHLPTPHLILLLRRMGRHTVDHGVAVGCEGVFHTALGERDAASPGDALAVSDESADELDGVGRGLAVVADHVAQGELLDDAFRRGAVRCASHVVHGSSSVDAGWFLTGGSPPRLPTHAPIVARSMRLMLPRRHVLPLDGEDVVESYDGFHDLQPSIGEIDMGYHARDRVVGIPVVIGHAY